MLSFCLKRFPQGLFVAPLFASLIPVLGSTQVGLWDFSRGLQGWTANQQVSNSRVTPEGWVMELLAPDPRLTGPALDYPPGQHVLVTLRMRSTGDALGQIYHGAEFTEGNSRGFAVINDGQWHDYRIPLPPLGSGVRLRLDPSHDAGEVAIAWIRVEASPEPMAELWASPRELRGKKVIGGGQYTTVGGESAVTSRFLARNPGFLESFPFDGLVLPVVISADQAEKLGVPRRDYFLHELLWNTVRIPFEALEPAMADLKAIRWGGVTENFLNMTLIDGTRGRFTPDLADDRDWAILLRNIGVAARLCREAQLQGFWLDTEQYGNYRWRTASGVPEFDTKRPSDLKFPLGKDTPEVLRRRGAQWIEAVQAELPAVKIMVTFAWSPDADAYGPLKGTTPFLNGVLDAIQPPARIIHGYENTFYYGQGPGTLHAANDGKADGFPGDRGRYEAARVSQRSWRKLSSNPERYDAFVKVGMAAWVEDDPWNLWSGFPSGTKSSFWSNLPLALAYSDEYVWVWSEHTHYGQGFLVGTGTNPFLASLRNQTFNTGREAALSFVEDFRSDPLNRGWYFDFDMLAIGRKKEPQHAVPIMSADAVPYVWSKPAKALLIDGTWPTNSGQRRRYARPIQPVTAEKNFRSTLDFRIERFGAATNNPIVLGLFRSDQSLDRGSLTLRITGTNQAHVILSTPEESQTIPLSAPVDLQRDQTYRLSMTYDAPSKQLSVALHAWPSPTPDADPLRANLVISTDSFDPDELGIALMEFTGTNPPQGHSYRYRLEAVSLER